MAGKRWGTFVWGDGTKWGASGNQNLLYALEIDWDGDSLFSGANEANRMVEYSVERGRNFLIRNDGKGFERFRPGKLTVKLENNDRRYDPFYSSSPLYPNVVPGKFVKFWVVDGSTGTSYDLLRGRIEDIKPVQDGDERFVTIIVKDGWRWLLDNNASIPLQEDISTDAAIDLVLDDISWPTIWGRSLGAGDDIIPFYWEDARSGSAAINELAESEIGFFYIAANGQAVFISRNTVLSSALTVSEDELLRDIKIPQPWEVNRNRIKVVMNSRIEQSGVTMWTLGDIPFIETGASLVLWANFTYENRPVAASSLTTPVESTDWTANTERGGTGSDLSSDFTMVITTIFSESAKITVANNGSVGGHLTLSQLRGDAVDSPYSTSFIQDNSGSDQPRTFVFNTRYQQESQKGANVASFLGTILNEIKEFPEISLEGRPDTQFDLDLGSRITIGIASLGISDDYRIGHITHESLTPNCQAVRTTWRTEPFNDLSSYWIHPAEMGIETVQGY